MAVATPAWERGDRGARPAVYGGVPRQLTVLYATETGTAEDVAQRIARIAQRRHIATHIENLADYDKMSLINETYVVFVVATTGNGEMPTAARPFWRFLLRRSLPDDILSDLSFATFGLGDSVYARFCWAARMLSRRLESLGAHAWIDDGEADDQDALGLEGGLQPWLDQLTARMDEDMPMPPGMERIPDDVLLPPSVLASVRGPATDLPRVAPPGSVSAVLTKNIRMTASAHFQDVRLLEFVLPDTVPLPADGAALTLERALPPALAEESARGTLTLRRLLTVYLDPFSVPRRSFFEMISHFSPRGDREQEKLCEFLEPGDGTDDMFEYAQRVRRTMSEALDEFQSVQVPCAYVMDLFPLLQARQYSIASGPTLVVALVKYKTRLQKPREGVCSAWIARLCEGAAVPVRIIRGTLLLPSSTKTPIVAVGPGTGIAPLRSIVHERIEHSAFDNLVVVGCRYLERDCLFRTEWEGFGRGRRRVEEGGERDGEWVGEGAEEGAGAEGEEGGVKGSAGGAGARSAAGDAEGAAAGSGSRSGALPTSQAGAQATGPLTASPTQPDTPPSGVVAAVPAIDANLDQLSLNPNPPPLSLCIAASRDQSDKVYVQDVLRAQGRRVWEIVGVQHGIVYVCGTSGKMPEQVRAAMRDICVTHGRLTEEQATRYLSMLEGERRWQEECW
ncbi:NAPDH-dependent diflavin reductase [Malassezia sp. CBS 17886]|nr:NAPDH-dependent diflavin reductase [Malassezia sp. CBS 17886]